VCVHPLLGSVVHRRRCEAVRPTNVMGASKRMAELVFSGLRPGEKLFEELLIGDDPQGTSHPRIMMAREVSMAWEDLEAVLSKLSRASQEFDCKQVVETLKSAPTGFTPNSNVADLVWCNGGSDLAVDHESTGKVHRLPV